MKDVVNTHNAQAWARTNPYTAFPLNAQHRFRVDICARVLGDYLIGPYLLFERINGNMYLAFLRNILPELLQHVLATPYQNTWFKHDLEPAYFSVQYAITSIPHISLLD